MTEDELENKATTRIKKYLQFAYSEDEANAFEIGYIAGAKENAPTVNLWHYPSKGELPDKDWKKHPLNVSKECFVLTKRGVGLIATWDNDYETWFEKATHFSVMEVIAWQYFEPPKEEI